MTHLATLQVEYLPIAALKTNPRNARTHSAQQLRSIEKSIKEFGFTNPILIDQDRLIIAGHGRVSSAKQLGMEKVPTIRLEHLSEAQKRAYLIADNKLAEKAGWDREILAIELQHLIEFDDTFDLTLTGFEMPEIDFLLEEEVEEAEAPLPKVAAKAVARPGDVWILGEHKILCADALKRESYEALMQGEEAHLIFTVFGK